MPTIAPMASGAARRERNAHGLHQSMAKNAPKNQKVSGGLVRNGRPYL